MQLQKFCCHEKEFSLPAYKQPMRDGRHVFASNLRIAIRAEISPECESSSGPVLPTIQKLFERVEERRYLLTSSSPYRFARRAAGRAGIPAGLGRTA